MSQQIQFLRNVVASVRAGREAAVPMLRQICEEVVRSAPPQDLATVGDCIVEIGTGLERDEIAGN